jgi:hypothetical protein
VIKNVTIDNFKGIKHCSIDQLAQINLFVGKNNSCKSTILEGIYYSLKEFSGSELRRIYEKRTNVFSGMSELWFNYAKKDELGFTVGFDDSSFHMSVTFDEENSIIHCELKIFHKTAGQWHNLPHTEYRPDFDPLGTIRIQDYSKTLPPELSRHVNEYFKPCLFLESLAKKDVASVEKILGVIKNKGMTNTLGEYLSEMFGQGRNWEFVPSLDRPSEFHAVTYVDNTPLFISGLGDGMRYALYIVASCLLSKNTAIFIEEIESNQHPSSLGKLIPFLVKLAKENNLQIFITTQSISLAWGYFEKELTVEEREKYFRCFAVERDLKTGLVTCTPQSQEDQTRWDSPIHKELYDES